MARGQSFSRRQFLLSCGAAGSLLPFPWSRAEGVNPPPGSESDFQPSPAARPAEVFFKPHYRSDAPLEFLFEKTDPAKDAFPTEAIAHELEEIVLAWRDALIKGPPEWQAIARGLNPRFRGSRLSAAREEVQRSDGTLRIWKRRFDEEPQSGPAEFVAEFEDSFRDTLILWAEFKVTSVETRGPALTTQLRYDLVSAAEGYHREQRTGSAELSWTRGVGERWKVIEWRALGEQCSRSMTPLFREISADVLGRNSSFHDQLAKGTDYWRSVLDGATGIDIYGNYGVAAGDFDHDGWDDLYVCQPAGLPNRLFRNRGDGTFEDVTDKAGVGALDSSPMALFADLNNDGLEDLVVVTGGGPLLFLNQGNGTFRIKKDAFRFASQAQGSFTGSAIADYDRDGWLDIYFCLYSYYQGLSRYRYPTPYYDARNGPPNFLFRNNRDGTFSDVTREAGLDQNNHRFSFACGWCDYDDDGWPDLYVANDFGQKNLYHNNRNGTFTDVAEKAGVLDTGAGMSVCWFDYDRDGRHDLYVADMWTAAGLRITQLDTFLPDAPANVRALYRKHAMGNSLFRNDGRGGFKDETASSGTGMGRWAWSSDCWDFDCDGFDDLYIANGMISGPRTPDLSSFFWRQVVARSPLGSVPTDGYEAGWNAINELIRSDGTWSGYERNVLYANNRDGTFTDVAGAAGLDLLDDSRSFALADIDHDGRQELILKNRTGPQLRIFHNINPDLGNRISFKLKAQKGAAIGAQLSVSSAAGRQPKFLQAGSGFLAQHSKEMFFGLGRSEGTVRVRVRWPSGAVQEFAEVPIGNRIEIEEGNAQFQATPFAAGVAYPDSSGRRPGFVIDRGHLPPRQRPTVPIRFVRTAPTGYHQIEQLPDSFEAWLIAPIAAPDFTLPDASGQPHSLSEYRGQCVLLNFWVSSAPECVQQLREFERAGLAYETIRVLAVNVDNPTNASGIAALKENEGFAVLIGTADTAAIYNLLYRYTFDRRRNLTFPITFLLDPQSNIVKIYQGRVQGTKVVSDAQNIPKTPREREARALPFRGDYYGGAFTRNYFTFGVAFAQHGYTDAAEAAFKRSIREEPQSADAYYDLGTLYVQKERWAEAQELLEKAVQLKPDNLVGLNNLGVIAARRARPEEAERYFKRVLGEDPANTLAIGNLADLYRTEGRPQAAEQLLVSALKRQPDNPELNYKLGMVFAGAGRNHEAQAYLEKTVRLEPDNAKALDNLGVVYALTGQLDRAAAAFSESIERAPKFDQPYLNLARVDVKLGQRDAAAKVLRALLEQIPNHPEAEQYLRELER